ncbi:MAG: PepSY domain-containing protein, partial [Planctomycetota bacterium]
MQTYKFFWKTHKWVGILLALVFLNVAITGILLLEKKNFSWIQPPTMSGQEGGVGDFIDTQELFEVVFSQENANFRSIEDIDRVDFRPGKRVFKVRS